MRHVEAIIVGQGLAGTAIAWSMHWAGREIVILDREALFTSSRIAAGLLTPITGQKFVKTWGWDTFLPEAIHFYQRVERATSSKFFHFTEMVRLFTQTSDAEVFQRRFESPEIAALIQPTSSLVDSETFACEHGGFVMSPAARLETAPYLDASRGYFSRQSSYQNVSLDLSNDIVVAADRMLIPRLNLSAEWIIFCQGIEAMQNPWFKDVPFKPAKGEILTLKIPGLNESRVIHRGIWLAPYAGQSIYRAGSTYDWKDLSETATVAAKQKILLSLKQFLHKEITVINHHAAVRPIHRNQFPVIGLHRENKQLAYFNGLGSKGSLYAPGCADRLLRLMYQNETPDRELDLAEKKRIEIE